MQGVDPDKFTAFNVLEDQELRQGKEYSQLSFAFEGLSLEFSVWLGIAMENMLLTNGLGIKEYSEWPTIPQLYVDKEFIGGCDILMTMHQDGSLAKMLEEKGVVVPAEEKGQAP